MGERSNIRLNKKNKWHKKGRIEERMDGRKNECWDE